MAAKIFEIKLCKDCIHSTGGSRFTSEFAKCKRTVDLVTGLPESYCSIMRKNYSPCGEKGLLFESKIKNSYLDIVGHHKQVTGGKNRLYNTPAVMNLWFKRIRSKLGTTFRSK